MNKEAIKTALSRALTEHETNRDAVNEISIPPGLEGIVSSALANALNAKLVKIFSEPVEEMIASEDPSI